MLQTYESTASSETWLVTARTQLEATLQVLCFYVWHMGHNPYDNITPHAYPQCIAEADTAPAAASPADSIIHTLRVDQELLHAQLAVRQERTQDLQDILVAMQHTQQRLQGRRAAVVEAAQQAAHADMQVVWHFMQDILLYNTACTNACHVPSPCIPRHCGWHVESCSMMCAH